MKQFSWNHLLEDCFKQKYILVLGNEILLEENIASGDVWKFLLGEFKLSDDNDIKEFLNDYQVPLSYFNSRLERLLRTKLFRVVITTSVDNLLERVMRSIWGDELKVINIYDEENDCILSKSSEFYETRPILYYAFGKALHGGTYACSEDDKLKIVSDWLNHSLDGFPKMFYEYVRTKKLLALGCRQDDWLFRFFWYSLRQNVKVLKSVDACDSNGTEKRNFGTIAIELDDEDRGDVQLKKYIKRHGILYTDNAMAFVTEFFDNLKLEPDNIVLSEMIDSNSVGGCFISYANEDFGLALNICLLLKERGFNVWFDNFKMYPGADYNLRIKDAIKECCVFIPIISETVGEDCRKGEFDKPDDDITKRYYLKEWKMAVECNKVIIPILCEGIDVKGYTYQQTPWCSQNDHSCYSLKQPFNNLVIGIKEIVNDVK